MAPEWHGPDTRGDFWECVWHNRVSVVVALAQPARGFQGCAQYTKEGKYVARTPPTLTCEANDDTCACCDGGGSGSSTAGTLIPFVFFLQCVHDNPWDTSARCI